MFALEQAMKAHRQHRGITLWNARSLKSNKVLNGERGE
jgi:hypothetical protein